MFGRVAIQLKRMYAIKEQLAHGEFVLSLEGCFVIQLRQVLLTEQRVVPHADRMISGIMILHAIGMSI